MCRKGKERIIRHFIELWPLLKYILRNMLIVCLVLIIPPLITFYLLPDHGESIFSLAYNRPWGILTSWLTHKNYEHLHINIEETIFTVTLVIIFMILFLLIKKSYKPQLTTEHRLLFRVFVCTIILSQIIPSLMELALIYYFHLWNRKCCGASLILYGLRGYFDIGLLSLVSIAVLKTIYVSIKDSPRLSTAKLWTRTLNRALKRVGLADISSLYCLLFIVLLLLRVPSKDFLKFIGYGIPQANVLGHFLAYYVGLTTAFIVTLFKKHELLE